MRSENHTLTFCAFKYARSPSMAFCTDLWSCGVYSAEQHSTAAQHSTEAAVFLCSLAKEYKVNVGAFLHVQRQNNEVNVLFLSLFYLLLLQYSPLTLLLNFTSHIHINIPHTHTHFPLFIPSLFSSSPKRSTRARRHAQH